MALHCRAWTEWTLLRLVRSNFDSLKSVPYPYLIPGQERRPTTSGESVIAEYYVLDTQVMCLDNHANSPSHCQSSLEITRGRIAQESQARAADEWIPADEEGKSGLVRPFSLDAYTENEIVVLICQLVDENHPLCDIEQQHWDQLLRLFRSCGYNSAWRLMSVAFQADGNPADTGDASMLDRTVLLPTLRNVYVLATVDVRHQLSCVLQLSAKSDQGCAKERQRVQFFKSLEKRLLTS